MEEGYWLTGNCHRKTVCGDVYTATSSLSLQPGTVFPSRDRAVCATISSRCCGTGHLQGHHSAQRQPCSQECKVSIVYLELVTTLKWTLYVCMYVHPFNWCLVGHFDTNEMCSYWRGVHICTIRVLLLGSLLVTYTLGDFWRTSTNSLNSAITFTLMATHIWLLIVTSSSHYGYNSNVLSGPPASCLAYELCTDWSFHVMLFCVSCQTVKTKEEKEVLEHFAGVVSGACS